MAGLYYHRKCGAPLFWRAKPFVPYEVVKVPPPEDRLNLAETFNKTFYCHRCFRLAQTSKVYPTPGYLTWVEDPA